MDGDINGRNLYLLYKDQFLVLYVTVPICLIHSPQSHVLCLSGDMTLLSCIYVEGVQQIWGSPGPVVSRVPVLHCARSFISVPR